MYFSPSLLKAIVKTDPGVLSDLGGCGRQAGDEHAPFPSLPSLPVAFQLRPLRAQCFSGLCARSHCVCSQRADTCCNPSCPSRCLALLCLPCLSSELIYVWGEKLEPALVDLVGAQVSS
eukprot:SAG22_NODE_437_length_10501_cov_3.019804_1_plen_118_part_10